MSINIVIFTIASIFILLLFFKFFSKSKPISSMYPFLGTNPFFGAQIDDDEKLIDENETNFNKEYNDKNKDIVKLQNELDMCVRNRTNLNNAIQKFRNELINTVDNTYKLKQQEVTDCDATRNSRIEKYINVYNKRFNGNINRQQVINKIASGTLNVK